MSLWLKNLKTINNSFWKRGSSWNFPNDNLPLSLHQLQMRRKLHPFPQEIYTLIWTNPNWDSLRPRWYEHWGCWISYPFIRRRAFYPCRGDYSCQQSLNTRSVGETLGHLRAHIALHFNRLVLFLCSIETDVFIPFSGSMESRSFYEDLRYQMSYQPRQKPYARPHKPSYDSDSKRRSSRNRGGREKEYKSHDSSYHHRSRSRSHPSNDSERHSSCHDDVPRDDLCNNPHI